MDSDGHIYPPEEVEKMSEAHRKLLAMIPEKSLDEVQAMNRHDRRAWYAKERKRLAKAKRKK